MLRAQGEESQSVQEDVVKINKANEILKKETQLWESFIRRNAPHLLHETERSGSSADSRPARSSRRLRVVTALTPDQKFFVATRELEAIRDEIEKKQREGEKEIERLQSLKEETDTRIAEYKKDAFEFRRDIVTGAINPRTGNIAAEKLAQYFELKIKTKEQQIEKLRLKNLSLKAQCQKLEAQLQHKEEMGEVFLPIDFDQLKIENQQYMEKIEERNSELLKLKVIAGNTVGILNNNKKRLNKLTAEHDWLRKEIKQRDDLLFKIKRESGMVTKEIDKASSLHTKLKQQNEEFRVPEVIDYVHLKAELYEVEKKVKDWERKVAIAEMTLKRERTLARSQSAETPTTPTTRILRLIEQQQKKGFLPKELHISSASAQGTAGTTTRVPFP